MQSEPITNNTVNKKELQVICSSHYLLLRLYWKRIYREYGKKDIHSFRVVHKKLAAFIKMINTAAEPGISLKISEKISAAYHLLGNIRNLDLQSERCRQALQQKHTKASYLKEIHKKIWRIQQQLDKSFSPRIISKDWQYNFAHLPDKIRLISIENCLSESWYNAIAKIEPDELEGGQIHSVRKQLKTLYYNVVLLRNHLFMSVLAAVIKSSNMELLLDLLGQYQDTHSAIKLGRRKKLHCKKAQLEAWRAEKNMIKEEIIEQFRLMGESAT